MTQLSTSIDPISDKWIDALFAKMSTYYGNKFSDMWRDSNMQAVKSVWAQELRKLSREDFTRGANALMTQEWPPTLPQFIKLCRPAIDSVTAYYEAVNGAVAREQGMMGEYSHPAIFWAAVKVGAFDLKHQTYSGIKGRWETALAQEMAKAEWQPIPEPMMALPAPAPALKEVVQKYITETQVYKMEDSKVDHRAWAKRIIQRHHDGDKLITGLQVRFAKEALSNEMH